MQNHELLERVCNIARAAGAAIMPYYKSELDIDAKKDGSPLTMADQASHNHIVNALSELTPDIPVLSEESPDEVHRVRYDWDIYWLVDPLDGTKEFINQHDSFTVNIALINDGYPVLGVVYTPAMDLLHYAGEGIGAYVQEKSAPAQLIQVRTVSNSVTMVASRSHASAAIQDYEQQLQNTYDSVERVSMGSSLKICRVAEGAADIYPRLGPTSEWDTAAAQCVIEAAGGGIVDIDGQRLRYNKANILNPWFLAYGDDKVDWVGFYCN